MNELGQGGTDGDEERRVEQGQEAEHEELQG
jgi:hypothetical protein